MVGGEGNGCSRQEGERRIGGLSTDKREGDGRNGGAQRDPIA